MTPWLLAARPKTLAAAVTPVLVGTALARDRALTVHWLAFACALLGLIFALRHRKYTLTFQALAVTSAVYGSFFLVALFFFVNHLSL